MSDRTCRSTKYTVPSGAQHEHTFSPAWEPLLEDGKEKVNVETWRRWKYSVRTEMGCRGISTCGDGRQLITQEK